jgi:16S rRNA (adenine1518-N6/adenine1519-N6)-dimethyltransferase
MSKPSSLPRATLLRNKLAPHKKFGQNFLVHRQTAEAIVRAAGIEKEDIVIEVGVGLGALTEPLALAARHVLGYEIDSGIVRLHKEEGNLPANVTLIHQDILKADFREIAARCGDRLKIVANLPYSISNPFIFTLIENAALLDSVTVMLQKEVAERLAAQPGSKEYGVPTLLLSSCATVKTVLHLSPAEFYPKPKVDSVVIRLDFRNRPLPPSLSTDENFALFRLLVRSSFNQRRKTILNTLGQIDLLPPRDDRARQKAAVAATIIRAGLQPDRRPETLSLEDFLRLTEEFAKARSVAI